MLLLRPRLRAIEALLMRKPVIYVAFPDAEDYFPHLTEAEPLDRDMGELLANVHRLSTIFQVVCCQRIAVKSLYLKRTTNQTHASKRIANLISNINEDCFNSTVRKKEKN